VVTTEEDRGLHGELGGDLEERADGHGGHCVVSLLGGMVRYYQDVCGLCTASQKKFRRRGPVWMRTPGRDGGHPTAATGDDSFERGSWIWRTSTSLVNRYTGRLAPGTLT